MITNIRRFVIGRLGVTMSFRSLALALLVGPNISVAKPYTETIEHRTFATGLTLENKSDVLIRDCQISNRDGLYGILLVNCRSASREADASSKSLGRIREKRFFRPSTAL